MAPKKKGKAQGFFPGTDTATGRKQWREFTKFLDDNGLTITLTTTERKPGAKKK